MNIERLKTLIAHLIALREKGQPERLNMSSFFSVDPAISYDEIYTPENGHGMRADKKAYENFCGTSACIAGTAAILFHDEVEKELAGSYAGWQMRGKIALGLGYDSAQELFFARSVRYPSGVQVSPDTVLDSLSIEDAIAVLQNLLDTGQVDWNVSPYVKKNRMIATSYTHYE